MSHAQLSPSSAVRWMVCPGSVELCKDLPDSSSSHADDGTAAHELGEKILLGTAGEGGKGMLGLKAENGVRVTSDMLTEVLKYTGYVQDIVAATGGTLMVEQRLPIGHLTGEQGAHGTSDTVILAGTELIVVDLKFGMGLRVDADFNPQLQIYALAALEEFGLAQDFETVRMVIHQPRLNHVSEWTQTVAEMAVFADEVARAAKATEFGAALVPAALVPSTKGCKWCRAKATCPALRQEVLDTFENVEPESATHDKLGWVMAKADLIEGWVKAIRAETERRLFAGIAVPGFKLVQGKRGNRAWSNYEEAEAALKAMKVKLLDMYDLKLVSPTTISKRLVQWSDSEGEARKPILGPRQQKKVLELITQKDGSPSVAPDSDKRPALALSAEADFSDIS
jgi:hypothetical protein